MKTNFKFFFFLIISSAFASAVVYGLAQTLVEKYTVIFSFGLMSITVLGLVGMMRNLAVIPVSNVNR